MATLADFRTRVAAKLGLTNTVGGDQPLMDSWANEAVRDILIQTKCYVTSQTLTPATQDSTLPSTLAITELLASDGLALERLQVQELLDRRFNNPTNATGTPRYYATQGANMLMLYPPPGGTETLTAYYVPVPTEMSTGTHDPSNTTYGGIPVQYHKAIELYMLWQGADYDDDASSKMGQTYLVQYEGYLKTIRKSILHQGGRRLGSVKVRSRDRSYRSSDNSVYP